MRWDVVAVSVATVVGAVVILSVLWRLPPEIPGIVLTVVACIAGLVVVGMSTQARTAWICVILLLGAISVFYVYKGRADQEAQYKRDKKEAEDRHREVMATMRQLYEASIGVEKSLAVSKPGTFRRELLSLSREILAFVLGREGGEPTPQVALMGGMPIPVGKYREYSVETGRLYRERFGDRVDSVIARLRARGLGDQSFYALQNAIADDGVARKTAEELARIADAVDD